MVLASCQQHTPGSGGQCSGEQPKMVKGSQVGSEGRFGSLPVLVRALVHTCCVQRACPAQQQSCCAGVQQHHASIHPHPPLLLQVHASSTSSPSQRRSVCPAASVQQQNLRSRACHPWAASTGGGGAATEQCRLFASQLLLILQVGFCMTLKRVMCAPLQDCHRELPAP